MRLVLSVIICVYGGSVLAVVMARWVRSGFQGFALIVTLGGAAIIFLGAALWQTRKGWQIETLARRLGWIMGLFYAGMFLGILTQKLAGTGEPAVINILLGGVAFQGAVIVLGHFFLREHSLTWNEAFGLSEKPRKAIGLGLALGLLCLPMGWILQQMSFWMMEHSAIPGFGPQEQDAVRLLKREATWAGRTAMALVTVVLAPVAEEILFRGIVYTWIRQIGFPRMALWGTALLFGLIHLNVAIFLPLVALSLVLALLYERTGNLLAPITAHALFNWLNFLMLQIAIHLAE